MIKQLRAAAAIAILACAGATAVRAQEVTQAEKEKTRCNISKARSKGVLEATKGLSEAQWNFKAGPDRWSIAQAMEHIAAAEDYIRGMDAEKVMMAPAVPGRDTKATDDAVLARFPTARKRPRRPSRWFPRTASAHPEGSLKHFDESRAKTDDF